MVTIQPDAVLVLGDTNSCLSVIGAKRLHIPIFHMEAGNRCKDECLPEETNRRIVDIISDVNMAYSEHARRYLADTGLPKERTYQTGSPMAEVLRMNLDKIEARYSRPSGSGERQVYPVVCPPGGEHRHERISCPCLLPSMNWRKSTICPSCIPVTLAASNRLEKTGFQLDTRVIQHEPLGLP